MSSSLIDAHAGALGMLAGAGNSFLGRLGLVSGQWLICKKEGYVAFYFLCLIIFIKCIFGVSGTSTCHMLLSSSLKFAPGVWGPFWSAVLPRSWLMEGGQSCTGGEV